MSALRSAVASCKGNAQLVATFIKTHITWGTVKGPIFPNGGLMADFKDVSVHKAAAKKKSK
jgi:hypothetical protein